MPENSYCSQSLRSPSNINPASSVTDEAAEQAQFLEHLKKFGFDPSTLRQPAEEKKKENTPKHPVSDPQNNAQTVNQQQMTMQQQQQWYTYQQQQQQQQ